MNHPDGAPSRTTPMPLRDSPPGPASAMNPPTANGLSNVNGLQMALQLAGAFLQNAQPHQSPSLTSNSNSTDLLGLLALQQNNAQQTHAMTNMPAPSAMGTLGQTAINMGPPVGAFGNDEDLLVRALCDSEDMGWTYRKALETLHGVNDHLASQWKDYYLDNAQRLNKRVEFLRNSEKSERQPAVAVKKPSFDTSVKFREPSSSTRISSDLPTAYRTNPPSKRSSEAKSSAGPSGASKEGSRRPRSPTPPEYDTAQEMKSGKNRFSPEERKYLVKYGRYRLSLDPTITKTAICQALQKKLPHHSAASWAAHWSIHREEIDKRFPQFCAPHDVAVVDDGYTSTGEENMDHTGEDEDTDEEDDIRNMGGSGSGTGPADKRVMARYAASFGREWAGMRTSERWEPFEAMYPQRKAKSWYELYRRQEREMERMIKKYRKRRAKAKTQRTARPSWTTAPKSPSSKRNRDSDEDYKYSDSESPRFKRAK
ncbi:hypothetical protein BDW22DRAFT_1350756 [Trametopsis cervina]|nr:hypothetical protein BDW22DRAFT_1350756 [Trametopsis cervina]